MAFLEAEQGQGEDFIPASDIYNAMAYTSYADVRVLLLGQVSVSRQRPGELWGCASQCGKMCGRLFVGEHL